MDPFTQRILERAEQRSKALGISKSAKLPLVENELKLETSSRKLHMTERTEICEQKTPNSPTKISRQYTMDKENVDVGIEINIKTGPNVEVQVDVEEQTVSSEDVKLRNDNFEQPAASIRDCSRNRLQRLGALYSNNDLSSPIHRTEGKFHEGDEGNATRSSRPKQKLGKLAALADSIKSWEDDTSHPDYKHSHLEQKKIVAQTSATPETSSYSQSDSVASSGKEEKSIVSTITENSVPTKPDLRLKWDKKVMDSLEAQGFQRRQSNTDKLCYDYRNSAKIVDFKAKVPQDVKSKAEDKVPTKSDTKVSQIKSGLVSNRTAAFESKTTASPVKTQKDPAEMSLKERMMLFEKNKGKALIPKAAFGMAAPVISIREGLKNLGHSSKQSQNETIKDFPASDANVKSKVAALAGSASTISESNIRADIQKRRQEDMEVLANRFNRQKDIETPTARLNYSKIIPAPPPPPPLPPKTVESPRNTSNKRRSPGVAYHKSDSMDISDDSKRLRKNSPGKQERLYPNLSDLDDNYTTATVSTASIGDKDSDDINDSFMDSEDNDSANMADVSLGREILRAVHANESRNLNGSKDVKHGKYSTETYGGDSSLNSATSEGSLGIDDYIDEALDDGDSEGEEHFSNNSRHSLGTAASNSFSYQKRSRKYSGCQAISEETDDYDCNRKVHFQTPVKSALTVTPSNDDNVVTLVHTVSFYRRQQAANSQESTPVRVVRRDEYKNSADRSSKIETEEESSDDDADERERHLVQQKIKKLLDEVCKQQQVIGQTSQALNLCAATVEFSGSTESVEGERHLLVATHRRQACLDEVQRLKVEGRLIPLNGSHEKGRLTVKEITVPLNQNYIRKLATDSISGHHLVCLLKYNENVLATKTVPTLPGLIAVKFPDILQVDVFADFRATLEVYGMTAQREVLPHEVKYHINLKKSGNKTPKKKGADSRLIMPMIQSPAGPNVVRTPALVKYGFAIFSLREVQRTSWTLSQSPSMSPLEGSIHMKINCELSVCVEYKGFLTMFEEISGFGAWHRRWCYLNGHVINYWKYPDDEKKKTPMGSIDLNTCCTAVVTSAPRDICARLNTLMLECKRPARDDDEDSFLVTRKGHNTVVRHLLSADTKDERDDWAAHINKTLALLRAWGKSKDRDYYQ